jgi:hypothetical protein
MARPPNPLRRVRGPFWVAALAAGVSAPLLAAGAATLAASSGAAPTPASSGPARSGAGPSAAPATASCTVRWLSTLGGRYGSVTAAATNGAAAGIADNAAGVPEPVLWGSRGPDRIGTGLVNSVPTGLNTRGDVVGNSSSGENTIGWVWTRHRLIRLRGIGALTANPAAISNRGVIAGALDTTEGLPDEGGGTPGGSENEQAAVWRSAAGPPQKLAPLPGDQGGNAFAVDPHGRVGGVSEGARFRAVIWDRAGRPRALPGLGGGYAAVRAFGPAGLAVGDAVAVDGTDHPVEWNAAGRITDLGLPPGSRTAQATGVLPGGVVVGTAQMPVPGGGVVAQAVRWTQAGHPELLGGRTGLEQTVVVGAASAGSAAGYLADAKGGRHPVIWRCGQ